MNIMGIAVYIRLEKPIPNLDHVTMVNGKSAGAEWESLQSFAEQHNLPSLDAFVSTSKMDALDLIGEEVIEHISDAPERWFDASAGLGAVQGLKQAVRHAKPASLSGRLLDDLECYETILKAAADHQVRFHFAFDF